MSSITFINNTNANSSFTIFQKSPGNAGQSLAWNVTQTNPPSTTPYEFSTDYDLSLSLNPPSTKPGTAAGTAWDTTYTYDASGAQHVGVDLASTFEFYL